MSLEQWLVVNSLVNGILAADAIFCVPAAGDSLATERINEDGYLDKVAAGIAEKASAGQIENALAVLNYALKR